MKRILFCAEMAKAYIRGQKIKTRRLAGPEKYGQPGDRVVLLTTWSTDKKYDHLKPSELPPDAEIWSHFDWFEKPVWHGRSRTGRFLPKFLWSSMPQPMIVSIMRDQLRHMNLQDAIDEGFNTVEEFRETWDRLNSGCGYTWESNIEIERWM